MREHTVEFPSEGATLRGKLFIPNQDGPHPALAMAHGTSATIPMVLDQYAQKLCEAGFAVLAYDHRNLGISDGEPRQEINPWVQARGFRDAITYLLTRPEVDPARLGLWGDSFAGMQVTVLAALDDRVSAVVAQVPACGTEKPPLEPSPTTFEELRTTFESGDVAVRAVVSPMPIVSPDQLGTPSIIQPIQAFRWFVEYGGRPGSGWRNYATRAIPETPVPFSAYLAAPFVKADLLMIIATDDEVDRANPVVAKECFDLIPVYKRLVELDGGHFGMLYYPGTLFDQSVAAQREFLVERLMRR